MNDDDFRQLILDLAGPSRDRARLARILHISESTAYGWIRLSIEGRLSPSTAVRGDSNRAAINALAKAVDRRLEGHSIQQLETELEAELRNGHEALLVPAPDAEQAEQVRRASLQRGLGYALRRLGDGASADEVIAATEAVLAMTKEGR
jgi:hypothetical protein